MSWFIVPLFVGQINVKHLREALFSERAGKVPSLHLGPVLLVWRRYRAP